MYKTCGVDEVVIDVGIDVSVLLKTKKNENLQNTLSLIFQPNKASEGFTTEILENSPPFLIRKMLSLDYHVKVKCKQAQDHTQTSRPVKQKLEEKQMNQSTFRASDL